jgi:hypothetical protein
VRRPQRTVNGRVDEPPSCVVEIDERLALHQPAGERDDPVPTVEPGVDNEAGNNPRVNRAESRTASHTASGSAFSATSFRTDPIASPLTAASDAHTC